jgi:hypothetical protein
VIALIAAMALAAQQAGAAPSPAPPRPTDVIAPVPSEAALRVAEWVAASGDNGAAPYIIIDKNVAALFLFDRKGKAVGSVPVLIGAMPGDEATPGIGTKRLAEIGPAERTTPAGRYLARFGVAAGRQRVLWVDYATSVAIHTIPPGNAARNVGSGYSRRRSRITGSPSAASTCRAHSMAAASRLCSGARGAMSISCPTRNRWRPSSRACLSSPS